MKCEREREKEIEVDRARSERRGGSLFSLSYCDVMIDTENPQSSPLVLHLLRTCHDDTVQVHIETECGKQKLYFYKNMYALGVEELIIHKNAKTRPHTSDPKILTKKDKLRKVERVRVEGQPSFQWKGRKRILKKWNYLAGNCDLNFQPKFKMNFKNSKLICF